MENANAVTVGTMGESSDAALEKATTFLSEDDIQKVCPMAFMTQPTNQKVSKKYMVATTIDVVRDLERLGWKCVKATCRKRGKKSSGRFSYHALFFQNPDVVMNKTLPDGTVVVEGYPRIILTNSLDGFNSFKFGCGFYRLACSNGMILATKKLAEFSIRHINYDFKELKELVNKIVAELPNAVAKINEMEGLTLTLDQKLDLAKRAYALRRGIKDVDKLEVDNETLEEMIVPFRQEDKGDSLWKTLNVIQERVIKGNFMAARRDGKARKVKALKSFVTDLQINRSLWEIAEKYLPEPELVPVEKVA
jgi:hypothetical protein